jgi:Fe-coproporphyrin III synthase
MWAGSEWNLQTDTQRFVSPAELGKDSQVLRTVPILVVHAHSSCNCRCIMCDIWRTRDSKTFGVRELDAQLGSIRRLGVRWVVFSGGEPLMNAQLPQVCALLRGEGIRLTLLSTGLLLKKNVQFVSGSFDDVIVSLDGPSEIHDKIRRVENAFEFLRQGIVALRTFRPEIQITARCTVQKANHACLLETAQAAKLLGLNGISFLAADLTSSAFNRPLVWPVSRQTEVGLSLGELAALENGIEALIRYGGQRLGAGFVAESPIKLRRIVRHFRAHLELESAESPVCNAPWVSAVIEVDGAVRPCFFHPPVGHLRDGALEEVINGREAKSFRANLDVPNNPVCKNCVCSLNYRP